MRPPPHRFPRAPQPSLGRARAIIQDESAIGGAGLPWGDTALLAELMLSWDSRSYRWALRQAGPVFDHAVLCAVAYLRLLGREVLPRSAPRTRLWFVFTTNRPGIDIR